MSAYLDAMVGAASMPALAVLIAAVVFVLAKGADRLVTHAVAVSFLWGVPRVVVGVTIVSIGTTSPETVVSVLAAFQGRAGMALGNAVGSVICDTGLILGLACVISPLRFDQFVVTRQGWIQFASGVLLVATCWPWSQPGAAFTRGGSLPQTAGVIFLVLFVVYMVWSVILARQTLAGEPLPEGEQGAGGLVRSLWGLVAALVVVVAASSVLIAAAEEMADRVGVPPGIVAATLVAFGTSLPELIVVVTATWKGHGELAIGNVIGADILNVLFVAGTAAAVTPGGLAADPEFFMLQFPAMLFVLVVFRLGIWSARDGVLRRPVGLLLLSAYVLATAVSYVVSGAPASH